MVAALSGLFKDRSQPSLPTATAGNPVCITASELIALRSAATRLSLGSDRNYAAQGGDYLSPFKGRGMEFSESRPYQQGDDIRNLDWRVTARTGKPHTKVFCEERERPVFLWVDYRAPMFFATRGLYKSVMAARLAALIGWTADHRGDRIGGLIFSDDAHHELKPGRGRRAVLRLIDALAHHPAWQERSTTATDPATVKGALARLRRLARPGSLIFLLSDFRGLDADAVSHLVSISRHNDCVLVPLTDPLEQRLPPPGRYRITDGDRQMVVDCSDKRLTEDYARRFAERRASLDKMARQYAMVLLPCGTEDDPLSVLQRGLTQRA